METQINFCKYYTEYFLYHILKTTEIKIFETNNLLLRKIFSNFILDTLPNVNYLKNVGGDSLVCIWFKIGATVDPERSVPLRNANCIASMSAVGIQHSAIKHF